jgi:uncharacterized membrane protein YccC
VIEDGIHVGDDAMFVGFIHRGFEFILGTVLGADAALLIKLSKIPDVVDVISDAVLRHINE